MASFAVGLSQNMKLNVGNTHTLKKINNTRNILLTLDIILLLGNARCACTEHVGEFGIIVHAQMVCTFLLKVCAGLGECTLEVGHENNTASRKEGGGGRGQQKSNRARCVQYFSRPWCPPNNRSRRRQVSTAMTVYALHS